MRVLLGLSGGVDSQVAAKLLQQQAFAYAVLDKVSNEQLKERLGSMVESRLRGEFSECSNCSKHCC